METILQKLKNKITPDMETAHWDNFMKQAQFKGNGIYNISGTNLYSTDTMELFLMFIAAREDINY